MQAKAAAAKAALAVDASPDGSVSAAEAGEERQGLLAANAQEDEE
jgi:hypothetical protein